MFSMISFIWQSCFEDSDLHVVLNIDFVLRNAGHRVDYGYPAMVQRCV